jgi:hypothetical protein
MKKCNIKNSNRKAKKDIKEMIEKIENIQRENNILK